MVLHIIRTKKFCSLLVFFLAPSARKNSTQLAKYPRVLYVKPYNNVKPYNKVFFGLNHPTTP